MARRSKPELPTEGKIKPEDKEAELSTSQKSNKKGSRKKSVGVSADAEKAAVSADTVNASILDDESSENEGASLTKADNAEAEGGDNATSCVTDDEPSKNDNIDTVDENAGAFDTPRSSIDDTASDGDTDALPCTSEDGEAKETESVIDTEGTSVPEDATLTEPTEYSAEHDPEISALDDGSEKCASDGKEDGTRAELTSEILDGDDKTDTDDGSAGEEAHSHEESAPKEDCIAKDATAPKVIFSAHDDKDTTDKVKTRRIDGLFDFIELFVFTLAAVLILTSFFVRHSIVDGDSMMGTLYDGENLLISDLFYEPEAGDIIVVEDFSTVLDKPIVKRVIAVAGQTVRIQADGVYVDGEKLVEDYVYTDNLSYSYPVTLSGSAYDTHSQNPTFEYVAGEYYQLVVPEGELFVMGDHRNKSTDSREIGTVKTDAVLGKVILRFYPFDKFGTVD